MSNKNNSKTSSANSTTLKPITFGEEIARGGEGRILKIEGRKDIIAKVFYELDPTRAAKIGSMLANPPDDPTLASGHVSIAWPLKDFRGHLEGKESFGYVMPYIDQKRTYILFELYTPRSRKETRLNFTWEYLLRTALNLSSIMKELHEKDYVVGDVNESNFLVTPESLVTLVDCDSMQVPVRLNGRSQGGYYPCTVGKPEFTPPELQGVDFSQVERTPNHDNFGLAVLIFLLLMEGWHPFSAVWKGPGPAPLLEDNIRQGKFPYAGRWQQLHPPYAPPLSILPPKIQKLMIQAFTSRHRPTADQWMQALGDTARRLNYCTVNPSHVYSSDLKSCPWCERMRLGLPDPFPPARSGPLPTQPQPLQGLDELSRQKVSRQPGTTSQPGVLYPHAATRMRHRGAKGRVFAWLFILLLIVALAGLGIYLVQTHALSISLGTRPASVGQGHGASPTPAFSPTSKVTPTPSPTRSSSSTLPSTGDGNSLGDFSNLLYDVYLAIFIIVILGILALVLWLFKVF